ncbi:hypothetical protein [Desulfovibrio ferrophilus]|uniref:Uncharacterized protein n=1 Tax=Desulfovibrio ferrophilus TaxID=241368 RepID=A0A2Z6AXA8_9BACT|nr:hypothetical protein [Desulfovibrio ferrophilus]BBD07850.1 hypothetical protein DFE_1124 [Desulfovibrio ferrophilus]
MPPQASHFLSGILGITILIGSFVSLLASIPFINRRVPPSLTSTIQIALPAFSLLLFIPYEATISPNDNIRIDLLALYPALGVCALCLVIALYKRLRHNP